jgi:hypothetical protein
MINGPERRKGRKQVDGEKGKNKIIVIERKLFLLFRWPF